MAPLRSGWICNYTAWMDHGVFSAVAHYRLIVSLMIYARFPRFLFINLQYDTRTKGGASCFAWFPIRCYIYHAPIRVPTSQEGPCQCLKKLDIDLLLSPWEPPCNAWKVYNPSLCYNDIHFDDHDTAWRAELPSICIAILKYIWITIACTLSNGNFRRGSDSALTGEIQYQLSVNCLFIYLLIFLIFWPFSHKEMIPQTSDEHTSSTNCLWRAAK